MGLLSKLTGMVAPTRKPTDDVYLTAAMLLMAGADGTLEAAELATVGTFATTLPEFKGRDFRRTADDAVKAIRKCKNTEEAVGLLAGLSNANLKRKCYVLCADIALSSGDVDEQEDALLSRMQQVLGIDDATAAKIIEVLSMKYAT